MLKLVNDEKQYLLMSELVYVSFRKDSENTDPEHTKKEQVYRPECSD